MPEEGEDAVVRILEMDREGLAELEEAYNKAVASGVDTFGFRGVVLVVGYAKFLIMYLKDRFEGNEG